MNSARRKTTLQKSTVVKIAVVAALVIALGGAMVWILQSRVSEVFGTDKANAVESAEVTVGSISTTVSGSGTLANEESEDTFISGTVEVTDVYVDAGDNVKKGDMLASVNSSSVVKAMKEVQDDIDAIDEKIGELEEEDIDQTITSGVSGRVKKVYVAAGDSVTDAMYSNDALMLISADGYMSVDIKTDALESGDTVSVTTDDATEYEGSVDAVWAGTATILVPDESIPHEATVTVAKDGTKVGSGILAIHEQVAITGFTGTVSSVSVVENEAISAGDTLMTIEDVSSTVSYATLLEERAELEDELQDLVVIHKEGAVYAQKNGMVTAITETTDSTTTTTTANKSATSRNSGSSGTSTSGSSGSGTNTQSGSSTTTVTKDSDDEEGTTISICPTDDMTVQFTVDETDILALAVGQTAEVTISALSDDPYEATITALDTVGTSSSGVTTYTATLELDKIDGMLEGMSASAVVTIEGKDDALLVPVDAVHKTSSTAYVYTSYDETSDELGDMVEVVCGLSNSNYIEISSGLAEGDTVYYANTSSNDQRGRENGMGGFNMDGFGDMGSMGGGPDGSNGRRSDGGERPSGNRSGGGPGGSN